MVEQLHKFDLAGQAFKRDPLPTFAAMRDVGPLVDARMPIIGRVTFATHYEAVEALLKSADDFSVELARAKGSRFGLFLKLMPGGIKLLANNMLQKDDPEHRRLRKLVEGAFRRQEIARLEAEIEALAGELISNWRNSSDGDIVRHVARDLPLAVISVLLGLPAADRPKFHTWMGAISEVSSVMGFFRLVPSLNKIIGYMREVMAERRRVPEDDLISALLQAEESGERLSDNEILAMVFLLFAAGHETTTHLISGGTLALLQNPAALAALREGPELLPTAVDELLRFVSPVQMTKPRFVTRDVEFFGQPLKRGQMMMALLAAANADPAVFDAPERLDLSRAPNRHLAFGAGPHFCLGAWLAKKEMEIYLKVMLAEALELRLGCDEASLKWTERGGMRALKALPLRA